MINDFTSNIIISTEYQPGECSIFKIGYLLQTLSCQWYFQPNENKWYIQNEDYLIC